MSELSFWTLLSHSCLILSCLDSSCSAVPGSYLLYFLFHGVPNVLRWRKVRAAGRPVQHLDSSFTKLRCCNSCSMQFSIVLLKFLWKRSHMDGSICYSKTCIDAASSIGAGITHQIWTEHGWQGRWPLSSLVQRMWHPWFSKRLSHYDSSDPRTV